MCGDSTSPEQIEALCEDKKANLLFTDPPYGVSLDPGSFKKSGKKYEKIKNDELKAEELVEFVKKFLFLSLSSLASSAPVYVCFSWKRYKEFLEAFEELNIKIDDCLVWVKNFIGVGYDDYRAQHEFIFYSRRGGIWHGDAAQSDVWQFSRESGNNYVHPTQKPVRLVERAILNSSRKGDVVLDPFGGSGTTLIACEKRGRAARLMELDPKYCDTIVRRWQAYTGLQAVHAETGDSFPG